MSVPGTNGNAAMLTFSDKVLPFYGVAMLLVGASASEAGRIALIKYHDRSNLRSNNRLRSIDAKAQLV